MSKGGGVKEAAKILQGLDSVHRKKLFDEISLKDPAMAEALKEYLVTFEDLKYLTVKMKIDLLKEVSLDDLAISLRLHSKEIRSKIMKDLSQSMKAQILEVLNGPALPKSKVLESEKRVMKVVRKLISEGKLILDDNDKLV